MESKGYETSAGGSQAVRSTRGHDIKNLCSVSEGFLLSSKQKRDLGQRCSIRSMLILGLLEDVEMEF
jgi:hypothetical protein